MNREELLASLARRVSQRVVDAIASVPRERFVPASFRSLAYDDRPLPIGCGQTISAPHMVAYMCEILDIGEGMKVLEIGSGFGYHAAVMSKLVGKSGHVYTVERIPELAKTALDNLKSIGLTNVTVHVSDGSQGFVEHAPYDRISVAASAPNIPPPLKDQLALGGKLVIPVGSFDQKLLLVTRVNGYDVERKMGVIFVPLIGDHGFKE